MLHDRQKLDMRISHIGGIGCQIVSQFPVIEILPVIFRLLPGPGMDLVDGHGKSPELLVSQRFPL